MITAISPGQSIALAANTVYALPQNATQISWQSAGGATVTGSMDNVTYSTLGTSGAGQVLSVFTAALFIKTAAADVILVAKPTPIVALPAGESGFDVAANYVPTGSWNWTPPTGNANPITVTRLDDLSPLIRLRVTDTGLTGAIEALGLNPVVSAGGGSAIDNYGLRMANSGGIFFSDAGAFGSGNLDVGLSRIAPHVMRITSSPFDAIGGGLMMGDTAANVAKPTCNASRRGLFWVVYSANGVKDDVQVCAKDAADAYAWRVIY